MRAGLALIAVLALVATPVVAQGKSKVPQGVQALEVCEKFAAGDVLAVDDAIARGWDAYEDESESVYVRSYSATKELPGIGYADMYALIEDYPGTTFGYCRMDVTGPTGDSGQAEIQAIQQLDRYEGEAVQNADGSFASLTGSNGDTNKLLLTHWSADSFVIQLTIITPKAEASE